MKQCVFTIPPMPEMKFAVTRTVLDAESPQNQNDAHIHKECEVYVNLSGNVAFAVEDRLYSVSRGSVIVTMPYEYHHCIYRSNDPHEHFWITFTVEHNQEFLRLFFEREKGINNRIDLDEDGLERLCQVLEKLMDSQSDGLERRILILHFFQILMSGDHIEYTADVNRMPPDICTALEYIDQHLCDDLDVRTLAEACNVSVNTLERRFKENLGALPIAVIRRKRLFSSMMYLKSGLSVTETAVRSGFSDYSNYIQLFRKQFGITPGQYKRGLMQNAVACTMQKEEA